MKRRLWIFLILLAVVSGGLGVWLCRTAAPERVRERLETSLSHALGVAVKVASARLDWTGQLEATDVTIDEPDSRRTILRVPRVRARIDAEKLLDEALEVDEVTLDRPVVSLAGPVALVLIEALSKTGGGTKLPFGRLVWKQLTLDWEYHGPSASIHVRLVDPGRSVSRDDLASIRQSGALAMPSSVTGSFSGQARISGSSVPLEGTIGFQSGRLERTGGVTNLTGLALKIGETSFHPLLKLDTTTPTPRIQAGVTSTRVNLSDLIRALPGQLDRTVGAYAPKGAIDVSVAVSGPIDSPDVAGELKIVDLEMTLPSFVDRVRARNGVVVVVPAPSGGVLFHPHGLVLDLEGGGRSHRVEILSGDGVLANDRLEVLDVTARVSHEGVSRVADRVRLSGRLHRGPSGIEGAVKLEGQNVDLAALLSSLEPSAGPLFTRHEVELVGDVDLRLAGQLAKPVVSGKARVERGRFVIGLRGAEDRGAKVTASTVTVSVVPDARFVISPRSISVQSAKLRTHDVTLDVTGEVGPGRVQLALTGEKVDSSSAFRLLGLGGEARKFCTGRLSSARISISGSSDNPRTMIEARLAGLTVSHPRLKTPMKVVSGKGTLQSSRLAFEGVKMDLDGSSVELGGTMEFGTGAKAGEAPSGTLSPGPRLDLTFRSEAFPVASWTRRNRERDSIRLSGNVPVSLSITGSWARPRTVGRVGLKGLDVRLSMFTEPLRGVKGELTLDPDAARFQKGEFSLGRDKVLIDLNLDTEGPDAVAKSLTADGAIDLSLLSGWTDELRIQGRGSVNVHASGPLAALKATARVKGPHFAIRAAGRTLEVVDLVSQIVVAGDEVEIPAVQGKTSGAVVRGSVSGDGSFSLKVEGLDLKRFRSDPTALLQGGSLFLDVSGTAGASLADLNLSGMCAVNHLELDLSRSKTLQKMKTKAGAGETGSALATGLLGATGLGILASASAAHAHFYGEVVDEALARHDLGTVASPFRLKEGRLALPTIAGEKIRGRLTCLPSSGKLDGSLDFIQLGKARFLDVKIGGTLSVPEPTVTSSNVRLGGKGPPGGKNEGQSAINLKTLVKPGVGMLIGWPVPVADLLIHRLFGKKRRRPQPAVESTPTPTPTSLPTSTPFSPPSPVPSPTRP